MSQADVGITDTWVCSLPWPAGSPADQPSARAGRGRQSSLPVGGEGRWWLPGQGDPTESGQEGHGNARPFIRRGLGRMSLPQGHRGPTPGMGQDSPPHSPLAPGTALHSQPFTIAFLSPCGGHTLGIRPWDSGPQARAGEAPCPNRACRGNGPEAGDPLGRLPSVCPARVPQAIGWCLN